MPKKVINMLKAQMAKVNVQVSLFSGILIAISCALVFAVTKMAFMSVTEKAYRAKTDIIFDMIEPHIDPKIYTDITNEWSMQTDTYNATRNYLDMVKDNYEVDNIFLAKTNEKRMPVYIMDVSKAYEKSYAPNSPITGSLANDVIRAFSNRNTQNGNGSFYKLEDGWEYIKAYPIKTEKSSVPIAVACIGINADQLMSRTWLIMILAALLVVVCIVFTILFANKVFKKISNPFYQDVSNTDSLTGLKNKNSFTVDFHNIENQGHQEKYSVIVIDLNGLKTINDTRGHQIGDKYIQDSAAILKKSVFSKSQVVYRIGGDEFVIIMQDASYADINKLIDNINANIDKANETGGSIQLSMSIGHAMFEKSVDRNFSNTMQRADTMMYNVKREYYRKKLEQQKRELRGED